MANRPEILTCFFNQEPKVSLIFLFEKLCLVDIGSTEHLGGILGFMARRFSSVESNTFGSLIEDMTPKLEIQQWDLFKKILFEEIVKS